MLLGQIAGAESKAVVAAQPRGRLPMPMRLRPTSMVQNEALAQPGWLLRSVDHVR